MSAVFDPYINTSGVVILDGALATELEHRGADLHDHLWSARLLLENPSLIKAVHYDYLLAGANIITTASYQASFNGFAKRNLNIEQAADLMRLSITLAIEARQEAYGNKQIDTPLPLVAASVGPYGASLADGSEYTGNYGLSVEELMNFHRPRMSILANSGADLLACETIPCIEEAEALIQLLKEFPAVRAWLAFSCKDGEHVCQGERLIDCVQIANPSEQVIAIGVNCTSPGFVESLIKNACSVSNKLVLAYPNGGGTWDAVNKCWLHAQGKESFSNLAVSWYKAGARLIGGCCRTSPLDIKQLSVALRNLNTGN